MAYSFDPSELALLHALAAQFPTADAASAEAAALQATLGLPKPTIHVISDIHGEYRKLRHVINNASGSLRQLIESLFASSLGDAQRRTLLNVLYYPRETMESLKDSLADASARRSWAKTLLRQQFRIIRALGARYRGGQVSRLFPPSFAELFSELLDEPTLGRGDAYVDAMIDTLSGHGRELAAVRAASRLVRNLSTAELIVAGDLGDRGPRVDRVIDYLMRQPNVSLVWGNHDVSWMGACLGQPALIATVVRFSLRYGRVAQLEEGYGITLQPLEDLARAVYGDDPAERFALKVRGGDELLLARMQKAIAIMQFKLEAQTSRRHLDWRMEGRNLLHRVDLASGTVEIDGQRHPLLDKRFPTLDPADPYKLSPQEQACLDQLRRAFVSSARFWQHFSFVARRGAMWLKRDDVLIFHACLPVDGNGQPQVLEVEGKPLAGRALMEGLDSVIRRAFRKGAEQMDADADWLWYLWAGPRSPLFGKDKIATFESHFVADKHAQHEQKNAYFEFIHNADFVRRVGRDFGMDDDVMIVNGHVPVKIEKGEAPLKRGGNAVTIDGAFSEAYGDHGYTLILAADAIRLAEHHHFESVSDVIQTGADIVPTITTLLAYPKPRTVVDTEEGQTIRQQILALDRLVLAYNEGAILESSSSR